MFDELEQRLAGGRKSQVSEGPDTHRLGAALLDHGQVDRFFAISPGLLAVLGFDGFFKMLNPAWTRALGYTVEELCAVPHNDLIHPDDRVKARDEALDVRDGYAVYRFKNRYRCKDGRYRWLEWCATPSPSERLVYASARDVTTTVELELLLRASNVRLMGIISDGEQLLHDASLTNTALVEEAHARDEVAAMLVHDLKSPLSIIMANYDYLVEGYEGTGEFLEALRDSRSAGRRMLRLLENLVDLGRLECRTLEPKRSDVNLGELLESVVEQRRTFMRSRQLELELVAAPDVVVRADADLLVRVVENVLDNAFRYTPRAGRLEVELRMTDDSAELRIGNSGAAIPVELRTHLFAKHGQSGDGAHGRMNVGPGLYFCRLAVEAQGGRIWIEQTERCRRSSGSDSPDGRDATRAAAARPRSRARRPARRPGTAPTSELDARATCGRAAARRSKVGSPRPCRTFLHRRQRRCRRRSPRAGAPSARPWRRCTCTGRCRACSSVAPR